MTAWAVATTDRFKAAVMVSGISNQLSSHYSCNHDFHGFINGGPLTEKRNRDVALDRSPLFRLDKPTTPTLILHGARGPLHAARPGAGILCRALRAGRAGGARRLSARGPRLPGARAPAGCLRGARSPGSTAISGPER